MRNRVYLNLSLIRPLLTLDGSVQSTHNLRSSPKILPTSVSSMARPLKGNHPPPIQAPLHQIHIPIPSCRHQIFSSPDSPSLSSPYSSSWGNVSGPKDYPLAVQSSLTSLIPNLRQAVDHLSYRSYRVARTSVRFIESIQHALVKSSYPLTLREVYLVLTEIIASADVSQ